MALAIQYPKPGVRQDFTQCFSSCLHKWEAGTPTHDQRRNRHARSKIRRDSSLLAKDSGVVVGEGWACCFHRRPEWRLAYAGYLFGRHAGRLHKKRNSITFFAISQEMS